MKIYIKNFAVMAFVGIYEHEQLIKQKLLISVEIDITENLFKKNEIIDYDKIIKIIQNIATEKHYPYIEEIAYNTGYAIKKMHSDILFVTTKVQKCIFQNMMEEISIEARV